MGNLLKPIISENGEMLGFKIREQVIYSYLEQNRREFGFKCLRNVIKVSNCLNKLFQSGHKKEFTFQMVEEKVEKQKVDVECQVNERELYIPPYEQMFRDNLNQVLSRVYNDESMFRK